MAISKPSVGETLIINKGYFQSNLLISQYFENLKPATLYEILAIDEIGSWGITIIRDVETEEIFDISTVEELSEYWCLLNDNDDFRIVPS